MKSQNRNYILIAIAIILIAGFVTVDFDASEAGLINLPDFSKVEDETAAKDMPINTLADINKALSEIVDETVPSVVTIRVSEEVTIQRRSVPPFFQQFFGGRAVPSRPEKQIRQGLGSGVIVSKDGYILTNNHVVANAEKIIVTLHNGREYHGKVVGRDRLTDIAVVKIDAEGLNPLPIGDSEKVQVGEMVLAIGSPLRPNLAQTVTFGIVSAKGRTIGRGNGYNLYIQTDAAINPGNSGGALVNMNGQLIGINSAIISKTGGFQGIGLAIPSNIARSIMRSLIDNGKVERGYLGVGFGGEVDATMARALQVDVTNGVIIGNVAEGSPADEAGLQKSDIIYEINGDPVNSWKELRTVIGTSTPGERVDLGIVRGSKQMEVTVTLGENEQMAALEGQSSGDKGLSKTLGFDVEDIGPRIAKQLGLESNQSGVVVTDVNPTSNAYRQGLRSHDIIVEVANQPVENLKDFIKAIRNVQGEDQVVLLQVLRAGRLQGDIVVNRRYIAFEL